MFLCFSINKLIISHLVKLRLENYILTTYQKLINNKTQL